MSLRARLTAQLLAGPRPTTVGAVVERCLAIQSQELKAGRLGVRVRSEGTVSSDLDRALAAREVVVTWVNRGTLHLVRAEDYAWLHPLTTPQLVTANNRRLDQEGVSPAQAAAGVEIVRDVLLKGPATRGQLRDALKAKGIPVARQALIHVLFKSGIDGVTVRGPVVGTEQAFVLVDEWLGPQTAPARSVALAKLGSRYLAGHGPSTPQDLAKWAGITLGDARLALDGLTPPTEEAPMPGPLLLGPWDELLLGWASRDDILGGNPEIITTNGIFKSFALVDGKAVATWTLPKGKVELQPFAPLTSRVAKALEVEARAVETYLAG